MIMHLHMPPAATPLIKRRERCANDIDSLDRYCKVLKHMLCYEFPDNVSCFDEYTWLDSQDKVDDFIHAVSQFICANDNLGACCCNDVFLHAITYLRRYAKSTRIILYVTRIRSLLFCSLFLTAIMLDDTLAHGYIKKEEFLQLLKIDYGYFKPLFAKFWTSLPTLFVDAADIEETKQILYELESFQNKKHKR